MRMLSRQQQAPPTLLLAAHGTQVPQGIATIELLVAALRRARPDVPVALAYLDVLAPGLATALADVTGPAVVVPALLSTGYHVEQDVPAAVGDRPHTAVSAHLGPDPRLTTALVDRLAQARAAGGRSEIRTPVALVATGSSRSGARRDIELAGADLAERLGVAVADVRPLTLGDDDVDSGLAGCKEVATYLLAQGVFEQTLRQRAARAGVAVVSDVLGVHPAVVELVLARYDDAARDLFAQPVDSRTHPAR